MIFASIIFFIFFIALLTGLRSNWVSIIDDKAFLIVDDFSFFTLFSALGSQPVLAGGAILLIFFLFLKRNKAGIAAVLIGVGGGNVLNKALKEWVARDRPPFPHGEDSFSFVSGHAMVGVIFYLLAAYFLQLYKKKKTLFYSAALLLAFLAGISRVAEKAHYATDVAAGWLLGGALFFLIVFVLNKQLPKKAA